MSPSEMTATTTYGFKIDAVDAPLGSPEWNAGRLGIRADFYARVRRDPVTAYNFAVRAARFAGEARPDLFEP